MEQNILFSALHLFSTYTNIPTRHFTGSQADCVCVPAWMTKDLFYYSSADFSSFAQECGILEYKEAGLFGYVHDQVNDSYLIAGPVFRTAPTEEMVDHMLARISVNGSERDSFRQGILSLPVVTDIQFLSLLNAVLQFLKFRIPRNVSIFSSELTDHMFTLLEKEKIERYSDLHTDSSALVDVINAERSFLETVREGNINADQKSMLVRNFHYAWPALFSQMEDLNDLFVIVSTLVSRAAIDGGMEKTAALFLQRAYIRKSKDCQTPEESLALQIQMAHVYTMQVHFAKSNAINSHVVRDAVNYINQNLSSQLTTQEIANALGISRGHLSNHFKKETGQNISNYILMQKIKEAQRLLLYTNMSIAEISDLLSFSSQSHFTSVFKKYSGGATPTIFRNNSTNLHMHTH